MDLGSRIYGKHKGFRVCYRLESSLVVSEQFLLRAYLRVEP